jgi:hypothetical protein
MPISHPLSAAAFASLLGLFPAASFSAASACDDDFSGPTLNPAWTFLDMDGAAGGSAKINAGKLELVGRGSDAFKDVNEFVGVKRAAVAGDFDVSVKIESQAATHEWAQAGILAANDAADPAKGGYVVVDVTPGNGFHAFYDASGSVGTLDTHVDKGTSAYPVWIRLARSGTKFSAWYRTQAQGAWLLIAEKFSAQGTGAASEIALISLSHNDSADGKTVFDDFICGAATAVFQPGSGPVESASAAVHFPAAWPLFDAAGRREGLPAGAAWSYPRIAPARALFPGAEKR